MPEARPCSRSLRGTERSGRATAVSGSVGRCAALAVALSVLAFAPALPAGGEATQDAHGASATAPPRPVAGELEPASAPSSQPAPLPGPQDEAEVQPPEPAEVDETGRFRESRATLKLDYARFYRRRRVVRMGSVLAAGGVLANTSADEEIQDWYRESVRDESLDELSDDLNFLGEGETIALPLVLAGLAVGLGSGDDPPAAARWLRRTARAYLVGAPALYWAQPLTGGDRPVEGGGSGWDPFEGQNGVSGHAFIGAVPWLTVVRQTDRRWLQGLALLASTAAGWSQWNDDQHYFSQYALGWWLAWEAADAVAEADGPAAPTEPRLTIAPLPARRGGGILVSLQF